MAGEQCEGVGTAEQRRDTTHGDTRRDGGTEGEKKAAAEEEPACRLKWEDPGGGGGFPLRLGPRAPRCHFLARPGRWQRDGKADNMQDSRCEKRILVWRKKVGRGFRAYTSS